MYNVKKKLARPEKDLNTSELKGQTGPHPYNTSFIFNQSHQCMWTVDIEEIKSISIFFSSSHGHIDLPATVRGDVISFDTSGYRLYWEGSLTISPDQIEVAFII